MTTGRSGGAPGSRLELDAPRGEVPPTEVRAADWRRRWWVLVAVLGPGVLAMVGENDGPSMISYAATGRAYGVGLFLPFILVTFAVAGVCQEMCMRVGAVTRRGFGELVYQRYGRLWGAMAAGDLVVSNFVTLVAEFIALRVGLGYFGVGAPVSVLLGSGLVVAGSAGQRYRRWERRALVLAVFNLLFVAAAVAAGSTLEDLGRSFATTSPLGSPKGQLLLLVASTIGATVTPWMVFFQQSAVVDKGFGRADIGRGRLDLAIGAAVAAVCAGGAYLAAAASRDGTGPIADLVAPVARPLFALGLVEAGGLAILTISASGAYAVGECLGVPHSFDAPMRRARLFYGTDLVVPVLAGVVSVLPGLPLLKVVIDANVLATVLLPVTLVFLVLLANDRYLMAEAANSPRANLLAATVVVLVIVAGSAAAIQGLLSAVRT